MARTYFFWDPLSDNILQERDETGAVTAEYTAEPGLYGNIISQNRSGVESQFHYDAQGSTLAVTDDNQNVTDTFAYTAFGEITERTGTTEVPFQYIGQKGYYTDGLTGQIMARERQYEPAQARWMVPKTLGTYSALPLQVLAADTTPDLRLFKPGIEIVLNAQAHGSCGGAEFKVKWKIETDILKLGPGAIIQYVDASFYARDCCNDLLDPFVAELIDENRWPAWEAWKYSPDTIATDFLEDNFRVPDWGTKTKGSVTVTGRVVGFANYQLPADFKSDGKPPFGKLPHSKTKPKGWPDAGMLDHELIVEWDCCVNPPSRTKATGVPNK